MLRGIVNTRQIDRGWDALKGVMRNAKAADHYAKVGVLGDSEKAARRGDAISNVDLALIQEFGTATIPARSFIRATFEAKKHVLVELMRGLAPEVYAGRMTVDRLLGLAGAKLAAEMKNRMREGIAPPLRPATVAWRVREMLAASEKRALADKHGWAGFAKVARVHERRMQVKAAAAAFGDAVGEEVPLINTGQLLSSITWAVVK